MQIKVYVFKDIRFISDLCSITCLFLIALVAAGLKGHCPLVFSKGRFICLIFRINVDGTSLDISYEEWRDYLLFHPSSDLADIISSWRHNTVSRRSRYSKRD